jgi:hypothetical protein
MHIARFNHIIILFSLAICAKAQDRPTTFQNDHHFGRMIFDSAADSVDLTAFVKAIQPTDPSLDGDTTTVTYRLVWRKNERGGVAVVSRGDGSELRVAGRVLIGIFENVPFRMPDGRRGMMRIHDEPCGLICRETMYYVEDRRPTSPAASPSPSPLSR